MDYFIKEVNNKYLLSIQKENLNNINLNDKFFDSLKLLYKDFNKWFIKKQKNGEEAYITKNSENEITSFLLLKQENEEENYNDFDIPFLKSKRLKICTFKVSDKGKNISKAFFEIILKEAQKRNLNEVYITVFDEIDDLVNLLKKENFKFYTYKNNMISNNKIKKECVYVKRIK